MRGHFVRQTKPFEPELYAAMSIKKACHYEAFIPEEISDFDVAMDHVKFAGEGAVLDQAVLATSIDHFNLLANIFQYGIGVEMIISDTGYNFAICGHIEGDKRIYVSKSCSEAGFTKS